MSKREQFILICLSTEIPLSRLETFKCINIKNFVTVIIIIIAILLLLLLLLLFTSTIINIIVVCQFITLLYYFSDASIHLTSVHPAFIRRQDSYPVL